MSRLTELEEQLRQCVLLPRPGSPPLSRRRHLDGSSGFVDRCLKPSIYASNVEHIEEGHFDAQEHSVHYVNDDCLNENDVDGVTSMLITIELGEDCIPMERAAAQEQNDFDAETVSLSDFPFIPYREPTNVAHDSLHSSEGAELAVEFPRHTVDDLVFHCLLVDGKTREIRLAKSKQTNTLYAIKVLSKHAIVQDSEVENVVQEANIHFSLGHPFIVPLHAVFQDDVNLYFMMEFAVGGDFWDLVDEYQTFTEDFVQFYASELVLALKYLHGHQIIHRDLKIDNMLIGSDGHLRLADFGLAEELTACPHERATSMAGTLRYYAPEYISPDGKQCGFDYAVDWWAFGVILHELLSGLSPFQDTPDESTVVVYHNILHREIDLPGNLSLEAKDLVKALLRREPVERLGTGRFGALEVMRHPFFEDVNWAKVLSKQLPPPHVPEKDPDLENPEHGYDDLVRKDISYCKSAGEKPNTYYDIFRDF